MNSSLRNDSESSRSGARIWAFCFSTQRCPDELSKHTLRSLSQTLRVDGNPKRERENSRAHNVFPCSISVGFFIVFTSEKGFSSIKLTLIMIIAIVTGRSSYLQGD